MQVGSNSGNEFRMLLSDVRTNKLFQDGTSVKTIDDASKLIKYVDMAMEKVSGERTKFGAYENALERIQGNVSNYEISKKWTRVYANWDLVISQLNILFSEILNKGA